MLNFRKIKQDLSPSTLKKGHGLYEEGGVFEAVVKEFNTAVLKIDAKVKSQFEKNFSCQLEIDKKASEISFSKCNCTKQYDCEHVVAAISYIEKHLDDLLAHFAKESSPLNTVSTPVSVSKPSKVKASKHQTLDSEKEGVVSELEEATKRSEEKKNKQFKSEIVHEYRHSWNVLANSPFFIQKPAVDAAIAQLYLILDRESIKPGARQIQAMVSVRLPGRVKPIQVPDLPQFFEAIEFQEPIVISSQKVLLTRESFSPREQVLLDELLRLQVSFNPNTQKKIQFSPRALGRLFHALYVDNNGGKASSFRSETPDEHDHEKEFHLDPVFIDGLDHPMMAKGPTLGFEIDFDYLEVESPKVMVNLVLQDHHLNWRADEAVLLPHLIPAAIIEETYRPFKHGIHRGHLRDFLQLQDLIIPEPMFGTLAEHGLRRLRSVAKVNAEKIQSKLTTLPCIEDPQTRVELFDEESQLHAKALFSYEDKVVPATADQMEYEHIQLFLDKGVSQGRDIWFESEILHHLFADFQYEEENSAFVARSDRQILDFMTRVIPEFRELVDFQCPQSLLSKYSYEPTKISLYLKASRMVHEYELKVEVDGPLEGISISELNDCLSHNRTYLRLANAFEDPSAKKGRKKKGESRVIVLDLKKIAPIVQLFDDLGIESLNSQEYHKPLWTLAHIDHEQLQRMELSFKMDDKLAALEKQMKGEVAFTASPVPSAIKAKLRPYQLEGVQWLERLRNMHLSGILADDMGLGKTLQTICSISQRIELEPKALHLIVCPTSLVYNWKEEFSKFNPKVKTQVVEGAPQKRRAMIHEKKGMHVLITSYSLLQKDIELYEKIGFDYVILDEAHYIKNRNTRNARSVKQLRATHRLILTGTPVENSLEELWSLFDFLMPGLLRGFDRFCEKYIRTMQQNSRQNLRASAIRDLRRRISPFILRRMKQDVLDDLPPVNEIVYHCHLSSQQKELYQSFAADARKELSALVEKEGFEKVQIHILATLTRLKQICCHPAIFAKEQAQSHDSAKYDLFLTLVDNLLENRKKAVVFSQYTKMLSLMKEDLEQRGVQFCYLDGTSKNRLEIVKEFNSDPNIPIFLVSLKAGGSGLNLVGADTVIHYDMWWNPAVENQATDRVHRIGQTQKVSSYKLVTLGTIEEKIVQLQNRKKGLVKQVINSDDDVISKLTWNEVLQLLSTD